MGAPYQERAGSPRGSPMGRVSDSVADVPALPVNLDVVPLDEGYDPGGAYWGDHPSLFCAWTEPAATGWRRFVRAATRREAGEHMTAIAAADGNSRLRSSPMARAFNKSGGCSRASEKESVA